MSALRLILSIILPAVVLAGCIGGNEKSMNELPMVKVTEAVHSDVFDTLSFPGKITSAKDINVAFRISGPVKRVLVNEGSFVKKGDIIALMDPRDYEIQLAATKAEYEQIKSEAERVIELHKRKSAADKDYDKAVAGLHRIEAKLEAHKNALNDTRLVAQFSGYIQKIYFKEGEMVKAGMPVVSLVSTSVIEAETFISAADNLKKDRFREFFCRSGLYPGKLFPLRFDGITPKANLNQLYKMKFTLEKSDSVSLSPGMSVEICIVCGRTTDRDIYIVPVSSLFSSVNGAGIWVLDEGSGSVHKVNVEVQKIREDGTALVTGDLTPGCKIVYAGVNSLNEGQKVRLLKNVSKTNVGGLL